MKKNCGVFTITVPYNILSASKKWRSPYKGFAPLGFSSPVENGSIAPHRQQCEG